MMPDLIRIAIISPAAALRVGLRALLVEDESLEIVFEGRYLSGLEQTRLPVDVLLMTSEAGDVEQVRRFTNSSPSTAFLFLIANESHPTLVFPGLDEALVWGVLATEATPEEIMAAIHALNQGLVVGSPALLKQQFLPETGPQSSPRLPGSEPLTKRETEVLQLLAQGLANKQIASSLGISEHTVKFHISSIYSKLGVNNRAEVVSVGARSGLISL
jgi:two-component system, NarL family, response regulator YdfI